MKKLLQLNKTDTIQFKNWVSFMESQTVLRIDDSKGHEYIYDGTELYRLIPLKGRLGRKKKDKNI